MNREDRANQLAIENVEILRGKLDEAHDLLVSSAADYLAAGDYAAAERIDAFIASHHSVEANDMGPAEGAQDEQCGCIGCEAERSKDEPWICHADLAQLSPAPDQSEQPLVMVEKPEVVAWSAERYVAGDHFSKPRLSSEQPFSTDRNIDPLMTVAQHDRIVGALRRQVSALALGAEQALVERDAAQARVAELEKQDPVAWRVQTGNSWRSFDFKADAQAAVDHWKRTFPNGEVEVQPLYAAPVAQAEQLSQALLDVHAERRRQVEAEGFDTSHDDMATKGQIARAAGCYALHAGGIGTQWPAGVGNGSALFWPWDKEWWKPKPPRENLVRAGAMIIAEIERLDRAAAPAQVANGDDGDE